MKTFRDSDGDAIIAAGQAESGEIDLIRFSTMTPIQKFADLDIAGFKDFLVYQNKDVNR